jgi:hypothetical protein
MIYSLAENFEMSVTLMFVEVCVVNVVPEELLLVMVRLNCDPVGSWQLAVGGSLQQETSLPM